MSTVAELLVKIGADSSDLRKEIAATKVSNSNRLSALKA